MYVQYKKGQSEFTLFHGSNWKPRGWLASNEILRALLEADSTTRGEKLRSCQEAVGGGDTSRGALASRSKTPAGSEIICWAKAGGRRG